MVYKLPPDLKPGDLVDGWMYRGGDPSNDVAWGEPGTPTFDTLKHGDIIDGWAYQGGDIKSDTSWVAPEKYVPPNRQGIFADISSAAKSGGNQLQMAVTGAAHGLGLLNDEEAAAALARDMADLSSIKWSESAKRGREEIGKEGNSFWGTASALITNPRAAFTMITESAIASTPSLAAIIGGGAIGGPVGMGAAMVGAGAGSTAVDYANTLMANMAKAGVNTSDVNEILAFMNDPAKMDVAREDALKHGIAVGVFDGLSAGIAGKILGPAARSLTFSRQASNVALAAGARAASEAAAAGAKKSAVKFAFEKASLQALGRSPRVAGAIAEIAVQGGLGGAGEMAGQLLSKGEIDEPGAIALEIFLEVPFGAVESYSAIKAKKIKAGEIPANMSAEVDTRLKTLVAAQQAANAVKTGIEGAGQHGPILALPAPENGPDEPLQIAGPTTIQGDGFTAYTDRLQTPINRDIDIGRPDAEALSEIQANLAALRSEEPDFSPVTTQRNTDGTGSQFKVKNSAGQSVGGTYTSFEAAQAAAAKVNATVAQRRTDVRAGNEVAQGAASIPLVSLSETDRKAVVAARRRAKQPVTGDTGRSELESALGAEAVGRIDQYLSGDRPTTMDTGTIQRVLGTPFDVKVGDKTTTIYENEYNAAKDMINITGRADKETIIEAIGDRGEETTNAIMQLLKNRSAIVEQRPGVFRPIDQLSPTRRTTPEDLPDGQKRYEVEEVPVDTPLRDWRRATQKRAPKGSSTAWGVVDNAGLIVSKHNTRKEAIEAKATGQSVQHIYANAPKSAYAVVQESRGKDGSLLGKATVDTFNSNEEALARAEELRGGPAPTPRIPRPQVRTIEDATQTRDRVIPETSEAPRGIEIPFTTSPQEKALNLTREEEEAYRSRYANLYNKLSRRLSKYGLKDIGLRLVGEMTDDAGNVQGQALGAFTNLKSGDLKGFITLAREANMRAAAGQDKGAFISGVMDHEVIHAMRALRLFTEAEWQSLVDYVNKNGWVESILNNASYREQIASGQLTQEGVVEEAIANAFRYWNQGKRRPNMPARPGGRIAAIFRKMINAITNWGRAVGTTPADDVFNAIVSGDIGSRNTAARAADLGMTEKAFKSAVQHPAPSAMDALVRNKMVQAIANRKMRQAGNPLAAPAFRRAGASYTVDLVGFAEGQDPSAAFDVRAIRGDGRGKIRGMLLDKGEFRADYLYFKPNDARLSRDLTPDERRSVFSAIKAYFPELKKFTYRALNKNGKYVRRVVTQGAKITNDKLPSIDAIVSNAFADDNPVAKQRIETANRAEVQRHFDTMEYALELGGEGTVGALLSKTEMDHLFSNVRPHTVRNRAKKMLDVFSEFDQFRDQTVAAAWAGRAKRGWYKRAANSIVKVFGVVDGARFAHLMAALSPQISVEGNLENTLRIWLAWQEANFTTDPEAVERIVKRNVHVGNVENMTPAKVRSLASKISADSSNTYKIDPKATISDMRAELASIPEEIRAPYSALGAWVPNAVSVMTADAMDIILSGPKVISFGMNLSAFDEDQINSWDMPTEGLTAELSERALAVTLDTWMGTFYGVPQETFRGMRRNGRGAISPTYAGVSAAIRAAANAVSDITGEKWTPMEVQETVWSFAHALMTLSNSRTENPDRLSPTEVLQSGMLTHGRILQVPDIVTMMGKDSIFTLVKGTTYGNEIKKILGDPTSVGGNYQAPRSGESVFSGEGFPFDESYFQDALKTIADRLAGQEAAASKFAFADAESDNFKRWFADSKIVDGDGNPITMYHVTSFDFDRFDGGRHSPTPGVAGFFTPSKEFLDKFGTSALEKDNGKLKPGTHVIPVYLSVKNPFDYENDGDLLRVLDELDKIDPELTIDLNEMISVGDWPTMETPVVQEAIKAAGFDAFMVHETINEVAAKNIGVFDPENIKSTFNPGKWSKTDPRMLYSFDDKIQPVPDSETTDLLSVPEFLRRNKDNSFVVPKEIQDRDNETAPDLAPDVPQPETEAPNTEREAALADAGKGKLFKGTYHEGEWKPFRVEVRRAGKTSDFIIVNARSDAEAIRRVHGQHPKTLATSGFEIVSVSDISKARPFAIKMIGPSGRPIIRHLVAKSLREAKRMTAAKKKPGWEIVSVTDEEPGQKYALYDASDLENMRPWERGTALQLSGIMRFFREEALSLATNGSNDLSRETIVFMSPDEYLSLAPPQLHSPENIPVYAENIDRGVQLSELPFLSIKGGADGGAATVVDHDGRHRMSAFKRLGYSKIPVRVVSDVIRWGATLDKESRDYTGVPSRLKPQMGVTNPDYTTPMPDSMIFPHTEDGINDLLEALRTDESIPDNVIAGLAPDQDVLMDAGEEIRKGSDINQTLRGLPKTHPVAERINAHMGLNDFQQPLHTAAQAGGAIRDYVADGLGVYGNWPPEWSSGFEALFPRGTDRRNLAPLAAEVFRKAKEHGQDDAYVAIKLGSKETGDHVRPGMSVFFLPNHLDKTPAQIRQLISDMPTTKSIGGMTAFTRGDNKKFIGLRFIWTPEYSNTIPIDEAKVQVMEDIDRLGRYFKENGIGSVVEERYEAVLGYRENYDELIGQFEAQMAGHAEWGGTVASDTGGEGPWGRAIRTVYESRAKARERSLRSGGAQDGVSGNLTKEAGVDTEDLFAFADFNAREEEAKPTKVRAPGSNLLSWGTFALGGEAYQVQMDSWGQKHIMNRHGDELGEFGRDPMQLLEMITRTMLPSHMNNPNVTAKIQPFGNDTDVIVEAKVNGSRGPESILIVLSPTGEQVPLKGTDRMANVLAPRTAYVAGRKEKRVSKIGVWNNTRLAAVDSAVMAKAKQVMFGHDKEEGLSTHLFKKILGIAPDETWRQALVRNLVNKLSPLQRLDMAANNGTMPNWAQSAFKHAESAMNIESRVAQMVRYGAMKLDPTTGDLRMIEGGEGNSPEAIFQRIGYANLRDFQAYGLARREIELRAAIASGRRKGTSESFSELSDDELRAVVAEGDPRFRDEFSDLKEFNRHLLNIAVDSGLMSREKADEFASMDYLPYYRVMESENSAEDTVQGPGNATTLNNPRSALSKKLKGGDAAIGGLVENFTQNLQSILSASLKNYALNTAAKNIDTLVANGNTSFGNRVQSKNGQHIMRLYRNGKPVHYKINDWTVWSTLASMAPQQQHAWIRAASVFSQVLRLGVTLTPAFMGRNLFRGKVSAYVTTDAPLDPFIKTIAALRDVLRNHPDVQAMRAMAGLGGYAYGQRTRSISNKIKRNIRNAGDGYGSTFLEAWADRFNRMIDKLEEYGEATELAERLVLYRHLIAKGATPQDAAYEAGNLINFGRKGSGEGWLPTAVLGLVPMVPFLNARIQGVYRVFENQKRQKTIAGLPQSVFMRGMLVTGISAAIWALNSDDERWDEIPIERKLLNDIFFIGDLEISLPRAFEVGTIFGALPITMLDAIKKEDGRDVGKSLAMMFFNTFAFNPVPQMVKPVLEVYTNMDFFRGSSVEPLALQHLQKSDRVRDNTSGIGRGLNDLLGGLSPIQYDHLIKGYFAGSGNMFLAVTDAFLANVGLLPERQSGLFGNPQGLGVINTIMGGSSFVRDADERSIRSIGDFYEMKEKATEMMASYKSALESGRNDRAQEILDRGGDAIGSSTVMNRIAAQISKINRMRRIIIADQTISPEEKRERLKPLLQARKELATMGAKFGISVGL